MPSSISSSETVEERPVPTLGASGWIAVVVALVLLGAWEAWLRLDQKVTGSYNDSPSHWAEQRRRVADSDDNTWVIIGSSRTLFNLQTPEWAEMDGRPPIQLALEVTTPIPVLEGLADDPAFTGKLMVGVAPGLFFSGFQYRGDSITRYDDETPTQWLGHKISVLFEPLFAFYTPDFALAKVLERLPWPQREGAEWKPDVRKLTNPERDRNSPLWERLVDDEEYRELARKIWAQNFQAFAELEPEEQQKRIEGRNKQIERALAAVEKLRDKGVRVIFVQMPYEGHYSMSEPDKNPRDVSWDVLIAKSGVPGLHFEDHPEMQGYYLPEWSHMAADEARRFTKTFHGLVEQTLKEHYQEP